jgi:catechol 2,3-dioxygenase-like lactoylglutathione lyase family enzyme
MVVKRIVANIRADDLASAHSFYVEFLGLQVAMNLGWIVTFAAEGTMIPQISVASEGGSGTPVPDLSIEVDDVDEAHRRAVAKGLPIEHGLTDEPWGVRRFFVRDPFGRLVNIVAHR